MNSTTTTTELVNLSIEGVSRGLSVLGVTKALAGLPSGNVRSVSVGSAAIEAATPNAASDAIAAAARRPAAAGHTRALLRNSHGQ